MEQKSHPTNSDQLALLNQFLPPVLQFIRALQSRLALVGYRVTSEHSQQIAYRLPRVTAIKWWWINSHRAVFFEISFSGPYSVKCQSDFCSIMISFY